MPWQTRFAPSRWLPALGVLPCGESLLTACPFVRPGWLRPPGQSQAVFVAFVGNLSQLVCDLIEVIFGARTYGMIKRKTTNELGAQFIGYLAGVFESLDMYCLNGT